MRAVYRREGGDGRLLVGDPQAAQPAVVVGDGAGGRAGGEQLEGRGGRGPQPLFGPAHRLLERLAEGVGDPLGHRPEPIRVLLPGGGLGVEPLSGDRAGDRPLLVQVPDPAVGQLQVLQRGDRQAGPVQRDAQELGQRGQLLPTVRRDRREPLLELRDGRLGALGLQQEPGQEDRPADVAGVLRDQVVQGRLRVVEPLEMGLDDGLARQEPRVVGEPGQALLQRLERRFELAAVHHPLGALGVGFDLVTAPLVFLSAAARAGHVGVDRRHSEPFSSWEKCRDPAVPGGRRSAARAGPGPGRRGIISVLVSARPAHADTLHAIL